MVVLQRNLPRTMVLLFLLTVGAAACGSGSGPASDTMVRDSAGIRLARNAGPDKPLRISEALRVGVIDGDPNYLFDQVRGLAKPPEDMLMYGWVRGRFLAIPTTRPCSSFQRPGPFSGSGILGSRPEGGGQRSGVDRLEGSHDGRGSTPRRGCGRDR